MKFKYTTLGYDNRVIYQIIVARYKSGRDYQNYILPIEFRGKTYQIVEPYMAYIGSSNEQIILRRRNNDYDIVHLEHINNIPPLVLI